MGTPMTPLLEGAGRKHMAHNLPLSVFLKEINDLTPRRRKCETAVENSPILSTIDHLSPSLYVFHYYQVP
jgi:hypothetical protein